jgi:CelD/BcsL family acetyltransferase involved in cellulose biosynthesis
VPPPSIHKISRPDEMASAVERFVALEKTGWKASAGLGIGKDKRHRKFYAELTCALAENGEAIFYFLRQGHQDMAGLLVFRTGDIVYSRHTAYSQEHAPLSPGIVLRSELIRELCDSEWKELDLLGLQPALGRQRHKEDWALGRRKTELQLFFRHGGRLIPALAARRLRHWLRDIKTARQD